MDDSGFNAAPAATAATASIVEVEEVLADGLDAGEGAAIDSGRAGVEAAVGRVCAEGAPQQLRAVRRGQPLDRVSLDHGDA